MAWTKNWVNFSNGTSGTAQTGTTVAVGTANANTTNGTINSGDLLLATLVNGTGTDPGELSLAGFTPFTTSTYLGTVCRARYFWRIADGTEGAGFTGSSVNGLAPSFGWGWSLTSFSGNASSLPVDASSLKNATGFTAAMASNSIAGTSGDLLVCMWGAFGGKNPYTDSTLTLAFDNQSVSSGLPFVAMGYSTLGSTGATGSFTTTATNADNGWSVMAAALLPGAQINLVGQACL